MKNPTLIVLLIVCALSSADAASERAWRPVESSRWIPISPSSTTERVRFHDATPLDARTWTAISPGDTLAFALRGTGTLRVETRALFNTDAPRRKFRLGVELATGQTRRLVRRSAFETWARFREDFIDSTRVGEVDRWEADLVTGSDRVRVFLRETRSAGLLVRVLAKGTIERPSTRGESSARDGSERGAPDQRSWSLDVEAASIGWDGNAYLTPADSTGARDAWYWPLRLEAGVRLFEGARSSVDLDGIFDTEQYDDAILDETRISLRLRQTFDDVDFAAIDRLRFEQRFRSRNKTFFGRGDLEEFETSSDVLLGTRISLADRFDWVEGSLRAEARMRPEDAWTITVEAKTLRRDYTEDYADEPGIWKLDQWRHAVDVRVEREFDADWESFVDFGFAFWNYDDKFSRTPDGQLDPLTTTRLIRWPFAVGLRKSPRRGLGTAATGGALWTDDRRFDYWDRVTWSGTVRASWTDDAWSVGARVRASSTNYENATVALDDPTTPVRSKSSVRFALDAEYEWTTSLSTELRYDFESLDNDNRTFAYDRQRIELGLRWQW